jgi:protein arginine kinase activator
MHKKILCDICNEKIATVHYTEIVNNKLKKMDLCEDCAKAKNIGINVQFSVADILKGLTESHIAKKEEAEGTKCPLCGLTFSMFRKSGKLGCGSCYEVFEEELLPIIGDVHKNAVHVGTVPTKSRSGSSASAKSRARIDELTAKLENAVRNEEYEEAAILRDKIRELEKKGRKKGKSKND